MKRALLCGLVLVMLLAMLPVSGMAETAPAVPAAKADAEPLTILQLQEKYPHGAYWNHTKGGAEDFTMNPCTHHANNCSYSGACGCNSYKNVAIQCMGFAYQLASLAYACDPRSTWTTYTSKSALDNLKAGDIVRFRNNGHSIFVTAVEGDDVTYADCNSDYHCGIRWNQTITKAELKSSFTYVKEAPYALPVQDADGFTAVLSTTAPQVEQEVTLTLTYDAGEKTIGGLMGAVAYDAQRFAYVSCVGDGVEVGDHDGTIKYVYYAVAEQAASVVTMTLTFRVLTYGETAFTVTTEEWIDDSDYSPLGNPTETVKVRVAAPTLTVLYHGGGGVIDSTVVAHTYRVKSDNGLNMRKDAGTSFGKVTALPNGTRFTVAVGDTKDADGYTWGKTTYDGKTGWVVISQFVEPGAAVLDTDCTLADGVLWRDGLPLSHTYVHGEAMPEPWDPATVKLVNEGYRFGGWCTAADGSGTPWVAGMLPEELYVGDTVTLYAVWIPLHPMGDVDGDGRVNNRDLGLLLRYLNGWDVDITAESDMNGDGKVNNRDLGLLQQTLNQ